VLKALILSKEISFQWEQFISTSNNNEAVKKERSKRTLGSINCEVKTMSRTILIFFSI